MLKFIEFAKKVVPSVSWGWGFFCIALFYSLGSTLYWHSMPALFEKGAQLDAFFQDLSLGIVVSYVFYVIVVWIPEKKKEVERNIVCKEYISLIYSNFVKMIKSCELEAVTGEKILTDGFYYFYKERKVEAFLVGLNGERIIIEDIDKEDAVIRYCDVIIGCMSCFDKCLGDKYYEIKFSKNAIEYVASEIKFNIENNIYKKNRIDWDLYQLIWSLEVFFDKVEKSKIWGKKKVWKENTNVFCKRIKFNK